METSWTITVPNDYQDRRLLLVGPWSDEVVEVWHRECLTALGWNPMGAPVDPGIARLSGLSVLSVVGACDDDLAVLLCQEVTDLRVHTTCESPLDLREATALRHLDVQGRVDPEWLAAMPLESLRYMNWPAADLGPALRCRSLRELQLDGARRLRTMNRDGVDSELAKLQVAYGRGMVRGTGLDRLVHLTGLTLERLRLDDLSVVGALVALEGLGLVGCGLVPDLEFVRGMRHLRNIAVVDSVVVSGDLSPLDDLPDIQTRYVSPKKGYNRRFVDAVLGDEVVDGS